MSVYIADAGSKYVVSEDKLSRAYAWLKDRREIPCAKPIADGFAEVFSNGDGFFCGDTCYGFQDEAIEFLQEFCEPYSYASFRNDDDFEYGIVWRDEAGSVHEEWEEMSNPFAERMDEFEFWSKNNMAKEA